MDKVLLATIATLAAGGLIALQAPINSELGHSIGTLAAASVNFAVGTIVLVALTLVFAGGYGELRSVGEIPWYYVVGGGLLGAIFVTVVLVTVRDLGAGGVTAAILAGQLGASLVIDRLGILGLQETPITFERVLGVVLLMAGTYLIVR